MARYRSPLAKEIPSRRTFHQIASAHLCRQNVRGFMLGKKFTDGEATDKLSAVFFVSKKLPKSRLRGDAAIPKALGWHRRQHSRRLATDVIEVTALGQPQLFSGPGDTAKYQGDTATVGVALKHPVFGTVLTTAGHLIAPDNFVGTVEYESGQRPSVSVLARDGSGDSKQVVGEIVKFCATSDADYLLIAPQATDLDNVFIDTSSTALYVSGLHEATAGDLEKPYFVLKRGGRQTRTALRGYFANLPFRGTQMTSLICTDACTADGDSGSCLVDGDFRLLGFLEGVYGDMSCFVPALSMLSRENASLA
jgi:hypothetical protein